MSFFFVRVVCGEKGCVVSPREHSHRHLIQTMNIEAFCRYSYYEICTLWQSNSTATWSEMVRNDIIVDPALLEREGRCRGDPRCR